MSKFSYARLPKITDPYYCIVGFYCEDFDIAFGSIWNIKIHVILVAHNILWQMSHSNSSIILHWNCVSIHNITNSTFELVTVHQRPLSIPLHTHGSNNTGRDAQLHRTVTEQQ